MSPVEIEVSEEWDGIEFVLLVTSKRLAALDDEGRDGDGDSSCCHLDSHLGRGNCDPPPPVSDYQLPRPPSAAKLSGAGAAVR